MNNLTVGVISAGAVGLAVAEAFGRAGHNVSAVYAHSAGSAEVASQRITTVTRDLAEAAAAPLVILAVPDPVLPEVAEQVAEHARPGQIVAHTSGANGCAVLQPVTDTGALPLALHPAMTFTATSEDTDRLRGCAWGVTADSDQGMAVAEVLVNSIGGVAVPVPEDKRPAYHAAMAHAANHLVTLLSDAQRMMDHVLATNLPAHNPYSAALLRNLAHAAVDNALELRMDGLTGPVARDDAPAVLRHLAALEDLGVDPAPYRQMAERTAQLRHAIEVERVLATKLGGYE
ncbi:MAG TPA: DUF2520 domain-containing protein [Candidatus Corynebacterium gallistercoris]|uniref:DUF2520 domain-containing protein n=1 Tax=Candidatus Corynebacterium gallistercoris TaxID=2838530 RepID=A0A9D1RYE4_9CORY|nr:DUF2520 domain-containing protein [Candidatus Corynebacterium gallistercoris]